MSVCSKSEREQWCGKAENNLVVLIPSCEPERPGPVAAECTANVRPLLLLVHDDCSQSGTFRDQVPAAKISRSLTRPALSDWGQGYFWDLGIFCKQSQSTQSCLIDKPAHWILWPRKNILLAHLLGIKRSSEVRISWQDRVAGIGDKMEWVESCQSVGCTRMIERLPSGKHQQSTPGHTLPTGRNAVPSATSFLWLKTGSQSQILELERQLLLHWVYWTIVKGNHQCLHHFVLLGQHFHQHQHGRLFPKSHWSGSIRL